MRGAERDVRDDAARIDIAGVHGLGPAINAECLVFRHAAQGTVSVQAPQDRDQAHAHVAPKERAVGIEDGWLYSIAEDKYIAKSGPTGIHGEHGHATSNTVNYEASVFWHWDGDCYNTDNWESQYAACVTNGGCWSAELAEDGDGKTKDKDKDPEPEPDPDPSPDPDPAPDPDDPSEMDPGHNLTETTILGGDPQIGRLFWREIVPE